jgi:hypothetical protein
MSPASLRRAARAPDRGDAFIRDFRSFGFAPLRDGDTEAFGRVFVWAVTSNDAIGELARDELVAAEMGGLFFDPDDEDAYGPDLD